MTRLEYTFKNDSLFKMLFVQYPELLKRMVSKLLGIEREEIGEFKIINPDILPEHMGEKFCRLDINMTVNGQRVDLEIQVADEGDYPERSLYYWAREYSSGLLEGQEYRELPRVVIISILGFRQFPCEEFHSEYCALEVSRHTLLTDRQSLHYFELPKLPRDIDAGDELKLWLSLFRAETEEELKELEAMEVKVMEEAIGAYRRVVATEQFREIERMRSLARHNEASALSHARQQAAYEVEKKWKGVVATALADREAALVALADKDASLADRDALLANKDIALADRDAALVNKDIALADRDALIAALRAQLSQTRH